MIAPAADMATMTQTRAFVCWRFVSPDAIAAGSANPSVVDERNVEPCPSRTTDRVGPSYIFPAYEPEASNGATASDGRIAVGSYIGALNLTETPASDLRIAR